MTKRNLSRSDQLSLYAEQLLGAADYLRESVEVCTPIIDSIPYSRQSLREFEAVTARYGRLSDFLLQKVLRYIGIVEVNDAGTIIDIMNRAEKQDIISAATLSEIRDLRNEIAHEYALRDIEGIARDVIRLSPSLLIAVNHAVDYAKELVERLP
jgi:hypothetical protein